jgi:acyl carrier protein
MGSMIDSLVPDLHALFSETLNVEVPSADADLIESGLLDSLRLVELLLHLEGNLGCRIPLEEIDLDDLRSVNRIARMIAARMEAA